MMKRRYRLLIPAVAPLLLKSGYLLEAWRHSPLDRWDWCFFLLAGILTAAGVETGFATGPGALTGAVSGSCCRPLRSGERAS